MSSINVLEKDIESNLVKAKFILPTKKEFELLFDKNIQIKEFKVLIQKSINLKSNNYRFFANGKDYKLFSDANLVKFTLEFIIDEGHHMKEKLFCK